MEVKTKIEIHNNGLPGEGEIQSFRLDVARIIGSFHFSIVPAGTLGVNISSYRWQFFFQGEGGIGQCNVAYRMHVTPRCVCSIHTAEWTCLQWTVHSYHTQWTSAFSAVRNDDVLFPNDFGDDVL